MSQGFTSKSTSINRTKLPAVYRKASLKAHYILDYGCGKYVDHIRDELLRNGRELLPYDPYNQQYEVNQGTRVMIDLVGAKREPVDIICPNVLNVMDDDDTIRDIAEKLERIAEQTGGTAYITVYEGDRSGIGRQTGRDQYQRNEPLRNYLKFFRNATVKNVMIVVGR